MSINQPTLHIEVHVTVSEPNQSVLDLLASQSELPRQRLKAAMTKGAVWLTRGRNTQRLRRVTRKLQIGDEIHLYYDEAVLNEEPPEPSLIADLGAYSVWYKPYGLRSQGSKWGDHCTLVRWAETRLQPQRTAFTVHRLDRAASGLMLIAHAKASAATISQMFAKREIDKRYRAWVHGDFSTQTSPVRVELAIDERDAASEFSLCELSNDKQRSLVDVRIESGRKHQIRRHLAHLGFPIVGDRLYGSGAVDGVDLQLSACSLSFNCPVENKQVSYHLPPACALLEPEK